MFVAVYSSGLTIKDYQGKTASMITVSVEEAEDDAGDGGWKDVLISDVHLGPSGWQAWSCAWPAGP
jgi:hypothetical protein